MRHLDLFSGIGGFALAASWVWGAEHEIVSFCEIEPYAQKVLKKHWPDVPISEDVKNVTTDTVPNGKINLVTGGFPCQDLSANGHRAGIEGERSGLWFELHRIIRDFRPDYAIIENVTGLLTGEGGRWFKQVLTDLAKIRYDAIWNCIPASSIGERHQRDRIFILAYPSSNRRDAVMVQNSIALEHKRVSKEYCSPSNKETRRISKTDTSREVDGLSNWSYRLRGLGNAIVPQVVVPIMQAIKKIELREQC